MDRTKSSAILSAFKFKWLFKIPLLVMVILNSNIGLNEHHFNIGGIEVVSGRPIEADCDSASSENITATEDPPTVGIYAYVDLNDVVKMSNCTKAEKCPASEKYLIVCGSDGVIYQNIGVLTCAQLCNKELKLASFGPCDGAHPLPVSTLPPIPETTTMVNYFGINVDQASQVKYNETRDRQLIAVLRQRIKERMAEHPLPKEWKEWCKENRDKCYYGFHPSFNPALYLIPVAPDRQLDIWHIKHEELLRKKTFRLNP